MRELVDTVSAYENKHESSIIVEPSILSGSLTLPSSKSHSMRWIILSSMDTNPTKINMNEIGKDVEALLQCLQKLGIQWDGHSITGGSLHPTQKILNCENSGTALRFLIAQVSTLDSIMTLDGDSTLRVRDSSHLTKLLGVNVNYLLETNELPIEIKGPFSLESVDIDVSKTSQYYSAVMLMTPRTSGFEINTIGEHVSRNHSELTWELCKRTGAVKVGVPWEVRCPEEVTIPPDASMSAFARLAQLEIINPANKSDSLGHILDRLDLTNSNDLITPMAAWLAIGEGGTITGARHAIYKESNRLIRTRDLLSSFGLSCELTSDGIVIPGNQILKKPQGIVETYGDHRIQMTAIILASKVGAIIENSNLHQIAWPSFLSQLEECGLKYQIE
ncbi:MAG: hypothetical protein QGI21_00550 [Candidatus Poseidoniaceae archaeon]|jgi:3-phosphoshikimate 1-carboxyvinyltransferase|nr:hypothetical protein [Candidatus Poseidoniaceae archaeon]